MTISQQWEKRNKAQFTADSRSELSISVFIAGNLDNLPPVVFVVDDLREYEDILEG
jgi:hypothetical protein